MMPVVENMIFLQLVVNTGKLSESGLPGLEDFQDFFLMLILVKL
jgi:hypothetical protein